MAHFAKLDDNNVVIGTVYLPTKETVNPISGVEDESFGIQYLTDNHGHSNWRRYSIHTSEGKHSEGRTPYRKNSPQIGWTYDTTRDAFIPPDSLKPFSSWVWDDDICWWKAPIDQPTDGITDSELAGQLDENGDWIVRPYYYRWNETNVGWAKTNIEYDYT